MTKIQILHFLGNTLDKEFLEDVAGIVHAHASILGCFGPADAATVVDCCLAIDKITKQQIIGRDTV